MRVRPAYPVFEGPCRASFTPKPRPLAMASSPNRSRTASSTSSVDGAPGLAAEEVALAGPPCLDEIMGTDADQAGGAAVGLAGEQRLGRPEHRLRPQPVL